jgi:hypothetical protein
MDKPLKSRICENPKKISFVKNAYIFSLRKVTVRPKSIFSRILNPEIDFLAFVIIGF